MPEVIVSEVGSFERALKKFKRQCAKAGILSDFKKHVHYEKPSERRKKRIAAAVRRNRKFQKK